MAASLHQPATWVSHETLTLVRLMRQIPDEALKKGFGLSLNEYRVLANIEKGFEDTSADLARRLALSPPRMSALISHLETKGLVTSLQTVGRKRILTTTPAGSSAFRTCRRIVQRAYSRLLEPLTAEELEVFDIGTLASVLLRGDVIHVDQAPDRAYIYIQSYSVSELIFIKHAHEAGLALKDLHMLLALVQEGPMPQSLICSKLLLPKSSVSEEAKSLRARGLVEVGRKGSCVTLATSSGGRDITVATVHRAMEEFGESVRRITDVEVDMFGGMASKIIRSHSRGFEWSDASGMQGCGDGVYRSSKVN